MAWRSVCKLLQRRSADLLSTRYGIICIIFGFLIIVVTFVHFGETLITWNYYRYISSFNSFADNIGHRSYRDRLCLPLPIDIVYTWVNGSDPLLIEDLRDFKINLESTILANIEEPTECKFVHCVSASGVVLDPAFPSELTKSQISLLYPVLQKSESIESLLDPVRNSTISVVMFENSQEIESILKEHIVINGVKVNVRELYYTSDSTLVNVVMSNKILMLTGFPHTFTEDQLLTEIPESYRNGLSQFKLHSSDGIAVATVLDNVLFNSLLKTDNITINAKALTFKQVGLVWDLKDYALNEDISSSRFEDNEELRYSLRSVEKFAPWVRHVYIVTNGQIPSWLNLDNSRVSIVSHRDIFLNSSHLPTFSSPAIESHLHRIPGVSERFIYMNDDVFFGKEVWPDDFFTTAGGQKVYLTWPVPNCQDGCPGTWIKDGYCDKACNNSECEWDGGDCEGERGNAQPLYQFGNQAAAGNFWSSQSTEMYCSAGCANNWIADRYCDQSCNVQQCGFDAGDCGTGSFNALHGVDLIKDVKEYFAVGHTVMYFNLSALIGHLGSIASGLMDENAIIRSVSIAQKFKVITLVLYSNHTTVSLNFSFTVADEISGEFTFNFTVVVDTIQIVEVKNKTQTAVVDSEEQTMANEVTQEHSNFIPYRVKKAPSVSHYFTDVDPSVPAINLSLFSLPGNLKQRHDALLADLEAGDITELGYRKHSYLIYSEFLKSSSEAPQLTNIALEMKSDAKHNNMRQSKHELNKNKELNTKRNESRDKVNKRLEPVSDNHDGSKVLENVALTRNRSRNAVNKSIVNKSIDNAQPIASEKPIKQDQVKNSVFRRKLKFYSEVHQKQTSNNTDSSLTLREGFLPWERLGIFVPLQQKIEQSSNFKKNYESVPKNRALLDTFASSLHHVSRTYNRYYGYTARKVPAHMPHMINKQVMTHMQAVFPNEWDATSSHRIRSLTDMQFAFSYFYFLMSHPRNITISEIFDELDVDASGILSDREVRTLATRIYNLPLDLERLTGLEQLLINCSLNQTTSDVQNAIEEVVELGDRFVGREMRDADRYMFIPENYFDVRMPQVTLKLVEDCPPLVEILQTQSKARTEYQFQVCYWCRLLF